MTKYNAEVIPEERLGEILPWVHIAISNSKRQILNTYHNVKPEFSQKYLDEFCYKFNRRYSGEIPFNKLLAACVSYKMNVYGQSLSILLLSRHKKIYPINPLILQILIQTISLTIARYWEKSKSKNMNLLKRVILLTVMTVVSVVCVDAQDIIVTQKAEKIEAKVLEVDLEVIRYKRFDNLEGAIYSISKSEIVTILYQNGTVDVFEQSSDRARLDDEEKLFDKHAGMPIVRHGRRYSFEGTNINMSKWDYKDFLERNCPQAYQSYRKGRTLTTLGIVFTAASGLTFMVGSIGWISTYANWINYPPQTYERHNYLYRENVSYIICTAIGGAILSGSIPMLVKGIQFKRKTSVDVYNSNCVNKKPTTLYFGFNPNGVNLTLKF